MNEKLSSVPKPPQSRGPAKYMCNLREELQSQVHESVTTRRDSQLREGAGGELGGLSEDGRCPHLVGGVVKRETREWARLRVV